MGTGTRDCVFPRTERESVCVKAKRGGVLGREEREGQPFASFFLFFSSYFSFLFSFFLFFCSVFSTKRDETKRNRAMQELFFFYERFGNVSKNKIQIIFI